MDSGSFYHAKKSAASGQMMQLILLGFPRAQALRRCFFAAGREQARKRRDFFANILFGRLHRRNVSGHLLLLVK
jgi:hypothetical protein